MRYRIKIKTFQSGRQEFLPQVKSGYFKWKNIGHKGNIIYSEYGRETREDALEIIDRYHNGNCTIKSIEFEYINK